MKVITAAIVVVSIGMVYWGIALLIGYTKHKKAKQDFDSIPSWKERVNEYLLLGYNKDANDLRTKIFDAERAYYRSGEQKENYTLFLGMASIVSAILTIIEKFLS